MNSQVRHLIVLYLLAAGSAGAQQVAGLSDAGAQSCRVTQTDTVSLRVGNNHPIYVEPQTFVANARGQLLLAGTPTYVWSSPSSDSTMANGNVLGVLLSRSGRSTAIPSPIDKNRVADVRAAALPDGTWGILFGEKKPSRPLYSGPLEAYWYGRYDGSKWRGLQRLPLPAGVVRSDFASKLVLRKDMLYLLAPMRSTPGKDGIALFMRRKGKWTVSEHAMGRVAYVSLDTTRTGRLVVGIVQADTTEREDSNSFFLYEVDSTGTLWKPLGRRAKGGNTPVHDPTLEWAGLDLVAGWTSPSRERRGVDVSIVLGATEKLSGPLRIFSPDPLQFFTRTLSSLAAPIIVTASQASVGRIQLGSISRGTYRELDSFPSPFMGAINVTSRGNSIFLNGPVPSFKKRTPVVTSLQLRFDIVCEIRPRR